MVVAILCQNLPSFISVAGVADSEDINSVEFDFIFDDATRILPFNVTIVDDGHFENTENFDLELRFSSFLVSPPSGVQLLPNVSTIYILDDDGKLTLHICQLSTLIY